MDEFELDEFPVPVPDVAGMVIAVTVGAGLLVESFCDDEGDNVRLGLPVMDRGGEGEEDKSATRLVLGLVVELTLEDGAGTEEDPCIEVKLVKEDPVAGFADVTALLLALLPLGGLPMTLRL